MAKTCCRPGHCYGTNPNCEGYYAPRNHSGCIVPFVLIIGGLISLGEIVIYFV